MGFLSRGCHNLHFYFEIPLTRSNLPQILLNLIGVTQACLNVVGKVTVSGSGVSVGVIARVEGMGSRRWVGWLERRSECVIFSQC